MDARLLVVSGPLAGKSFPISGEEFVIGRESTNAVCLSSGRVSRRHCLISQAEERYKIKDLGSSNGTFVNDLPIREHLLRHGDQIKIASSLFVFSLGDGDELPLPDPIHLEEGPSLSGSESYLRTEDSRYLTIQDLVAHAPSDRMARDLTALLKISRIINTIQEADELHGQLLHLIVEIIPAERGAILAFREGGEYYSSVSHWQKDAASNQPLPVSRTIVDRVQRERIAILSNRQREDETFQAKSLVESKACSVLCVPLIVSDQLLGIIYLETSNSSAPFQDDDLHLVTAIANIGAIASQNAQHLRWLRGENRRLKQDIDIQHNMVGESQPIRRVQQVIAKAAPTDSSVLIFGESGTGKELAAQALHRNSLRAEMPFVAINCATLTETLLESELFGHEKGAFTGATTQKKGKLEVANRGTVFLDEVGELDPALQAKLLRVLQEHEFDRVGGSRPIPVDIRLIAATNRDLEEAIVEGAFRRDLYYRLNVVSFEMPPLRDRREDIPLLAQHFLARSSKECNRTVAAISPEARTCLMRYDWPGNVRELQNTIERAVVLGSSDVILREDLPEVLLETEPITGDPWNYHEVVKEKKKELILRAVEQAQGNYTEAAKLLQLHPNYLHRLIRNLELKARLKKE